MLATETQSHGERRLQSVGIPVLGVSYLPPRRGATERRLLVILSEFSEPRDRRIRQPLSVETTDLLP